MRLGRLLVPVVLVVLWLPFVAFEPRAWAVILLGLTNYDLEGWGVLGWSVVIALTLSTYRLVARPERRGWLALLIPAALLWMLAGLAWAVGG